MTTLVEFTQMCPMIHYVFFMSAFIVYTSIALEIIWNTSFIEQLQGHNTMQLLMDIKRLRLAEVLNLIWIGKCELEMSGYEEVCSEEMLMTAFGGTFNHSRTTKGNRLERNCLWQKEYLLQITTQYFNLIQLFLEYKTTMLQHNAQFMSLQVFNQMVRALCCYFCRLEKTRYYKQNQALR